MNLTNVSGKGKCVYFKMQGGKHEINITEEGWIPLKDMVLMRNIAVWTISYGEFVGVGHEQTTQISLHSVDVYKACTSQLWTAMIHTQVVWHLGFVLTMLVLVICWRNIESSSHHKTLVAYADIYHNIRRLWCQRWVTGHHFSSPEIRFSMAWRRPNQYHNQSGWFHTSR